MSFFDSIEYEIKVFSFYSTIILTKMIVRNKLILIFLKFKIMKKTILPMLLLFAVSIVLASTPKENNSFIEMEEVLQPKLTKADFNTEAENIIFTNELEESLCVWVCRTCITDLQTGVKYCTPWVCCEDQQ